MAVLDGDAAESLPEGHLGIDIRGVKVPVSSSDAGVIGSAQLRLHRSKGSSSEEKKGAEFHRAQYQFQWVRSDGWFAWAV